jgi:hypothetical protein
MLSCLSQINQLPGINIIYLAGSSGEFFSFALSESFPGISKFHNKFSGQSNCYSHNNRVLFNDFFGRSLLTGTASNDDHDLVLKRINWYLEHAVPNTGIHIGIAHPHTEYLEFLTHYCTSWKTITITVNSHGSQAFCELAKKNKLPKDDAVMLCNKEFNLTKFAGQKNLNIEWQDFVLAPGNHTFASLENFLGIRGNFDIFETMRQEYLERNQQLISLIQPLL